MKRTFAFLLALLCLAGLGQCDGWSVSYNGSILQASYGTASSSPQYVAIHLDSGYLRMNYGPPSGWGTSIVVMPSYWAGGIYRQGYPVSESHYLDGDDLVVGLHGVSTTLSTDATITFLPPSNGYFKARVQAVTSGNVNLDSRPGEAFKPLMFSSMHDSATSWDASAPYVGSVQYGFPGGGWIISPGAAVSGSRLGLLGGSSTWKTNAPAVDVRLATPMQICGWLNADTNPNDDNVGYWPASASVLPSWSYEITVSNATTPPNVVGGTVSLQDFRGSVQGLATSIELRPTGSMTLIDVEPAILDSNGHFSVTTPIAPGFYDVSLKYGHWLRQTLPSVAVPSASALDLSFSLVNGDINGDNGVTLGDFALLRGAFGSNPASPNWNANADLNGDGLVNLADFAIIRNNFGRQGDR